MAYEKRMCVMKQLKKGFSSDGGALSGVVYAEKMGDELTVTPRLLGLSALTEGRYALVIRAGGGTAVFELSGGESLKTTFPPSLRDGFSALLCFVRGDAEGILYGACGTAFPPETLLEALVPREKKEARGGSEPFREIGYDDEAIASDNFYQSERNGDGGGKGGALEEEAEEEGGGDPHEDETAPYPRGTLAYYKEVRERLDEVKKRFPRDDRLKGAFPQSEWFRTEAALLGIVYENGLPRYLCVAVEKKGKTPPPEMKDSCCFVPAFPGSDEGFFVTFQDADTGEAVKVYST